MTSVIGAVKCHSVVWELHSGLIRQKNTIVHRSKFLSCNGNGTKMALTIPMDHPATLIWMGMFVLLWFSFYGASLYVPVLIPVEKYCQKVLRHFGRKMSSTSEVLFWLFTNSLWQYLEQSFVIGQHFISCEQAIREEKNWFQLQLITTYLLCRPSNFSPVTD